MAILLKNLPEPVMNLIYDKQAELKKKRKGTISLEKTIEVLLRDAYLNDDRKTRKKTGESIPKEDPWRCGSGLVPTRSECP